MIRIIGLVLIAACLISCASNPQGESGKSVQLMGGEYAKEANENPFLDGELNPKYEGEVTALLGVVVDLKPTKQKYPVYKLNLGIDGVNHIWVTSIASQPDGGIKLGDAIVFKGFITSAASTDPSGELGRMISRKMLLMAVQSQRAVFK